MDENVTLFMAETTSIDQRYRFFNFSFTCFLYSLCRLVDRGVALSLGENPDDVRQARASTFLTIAKQYYGLDPPD
jgi:putative transposase